MSRADVKLGFSCNNRCEFCVQGDKRARYPDRDTDEVKAILTRERETCEDVVLTGGEVTIRKDLPEIVRHARALGFRTIQVQTNGRRLARMDYLQALVEAGMTEVSPAVHGMDAETHDALTRAPGAFRQTVKGILNARKLGLPVITNTVVVQGNYRQMPRIAALLIKLDVTQFQLAWVHALGTAAQNFDTIVPRYRDAMPSLRKALDLGRAAGVRCMTEAVPLCMLPDHQEFAAEWHIPRTRIVDANQIIEDYTATRWEEGKAHGPPCQGCALADRCEGPWREYPERFGWEEFVAVQ